MSNNAVANTNNVRAITPSQQSGIAPWGEMMAQAEVLVRSGFLPSSIKTAEQALTIVLTGDELGLPKMLALRSIHIVQGRPTLSADLMASLVLREIDRHKDGLLMVQPPTAEACSVRFRRWGWAEEQSYTYTIADAQRAGLVGKDTWKAHPAAMLRARATAAVCRMAFPDVVAGLYAVGEIDAESADEGAEDWGFGAEKWSKAEDASGQSQPRVDVVEAQVRGLPVADPAVIFDGEIVNAETGEFAGEQSFGAQDGPANQAGGITRSQAARILALRDAMKLADLMSAICAEVTGISNVRLLSEKQANDLLVHLEAMAAQAGVRVAS